MSSAQPSDSPTAGRSISSAQHGSQDSLRATVWIVLLLLAVQFALGIYANLYVAFPAPRSSTSLMPGMSVNGMSTVMDHVGLMLHNVLGILLVLLGIVAFTFALRTASSVAIGLASVGLAALIGAGIAGMVFVMSGQPNGASYLMAIGFLVAFAAYFLELVELRS
jgi:hypothetical protein